VASLSQGRTAAAQCGLFTHKSVPVIFEPPCISAKINHVQNSYTLNSVHSVTLCYCIFKCTKSFVWTSINYRSWYWISWLGEDIIIQSDRLLLGSLGFGSQIIQCYFLSPRPDCLWSPNSHIANRYRGPFPRR